MTPRLVATAPASTTGAASDEVDEASKVRETVKLLVDCRLRPGAVIFVIRERRREAKTLQRGSPLQTVLVRAFLIWSTVVPAGMDVSIRVTWLIVTVAVAWVPAVSVAAELIVFTRASVVRVEATAGDSASTDVVEKDTGG